METATIVTGAGALIGGTIGAIAIKVNQIDEPILMGVLIGAFIGVGIVLVTGMTIEHRQLSKKLKKL